MLNDFDTSKSWQNKGQNGPEVELMTADSVVSWGQQSLLLSAWQHGEQSRCKLLSEFDCMIADMKASESCQNKSKHGVLSCMIANSIVCWQQQNVLVGAQQFGDERELTVSLS